MNIVATRLRCGETFNDHFIANLLMCQRKNFENRSTSERLMKLCKKNLGPRPSGLLFGTTMYISCICNALRCEEVSQQQGDARNSLL